MISKEEQRGDLYAVIVTDIGVSHRLSNKPNQDAVLYSFSEEDYKLGKLIGYGAQGVVYETENGNMMIKSLKSTFFTDFCPCGARSAVLRRIHLFWTPA